MTKTLIIRDDGDDYSKSLQALFDEPSSPAPVAAEAEPGESIELEMIGMSDEPGLEQELRKEKEGAPQADQPSSDAPELAAELAERKEADQDLRRGMLEKATRQIRRDLEKAYASAEFWSTSNSPYLKKVEHGGLCRDIRFSGQPPVIDFFFGERSVPGLGSLRVDTGTGVVKVRGKANDLDETIMARLMIEVAQKMDWKFIAFKGSKEFVAMAANLARSAGLEVVEPAALARLRREREDGAPQMEGLAAQEPDLEPVVEQDAPQPGMSP